MSRPKVGRFSFLYFYIETEFMELCGRLVQFLEKIMSESSMTCCAVKDMVKKSLSDTATVMSDLD